MDEFPGSSIEAKLVSKDASRVTLEKADGTQLVVPLAQLSKQDEKVKLAMSADKAIAAFVAKFLGDGNPSKDHTADPKRVADANKKAEAFASLPHAELLKKLAEPSPGG